MLYFVTGASGSGKTACMAYLDELNNDPKLYDFDDLATGGDLGTAWRQRTTERWLRTAIRHQEEGRDTVICGGAVLGEILACPSAPEVDGIAVCALDCRDLVRVERLRALRPELATQDMLNWAAWLRVHVADPTWEPHVIRTGEVPEMQWSRWESWQRGDPRWHAWTLNVSEMSLPQIGDWLTNWINDENTRIQVRRAAAL